MRRRQFISVAGGLGFGCLAGCVGAEDSNDGVPEDEWNPDMSAEEPEVSPGEETRLTVEADNVGGFRFLEIPDETHISFPVTEDRVEITPQPDSGEDTLPPRWYWDDRTSATVETPISVDSDADPGEYTYEVRVYPEENADEERTETYAITIVD